MKLVNAFESIACVGRFYLLVTLSLTFPAFALEAQNVHQRIWKPGDLARTLSSRYAGIKDFLRSRGVKVHAQERYNRLIDKEGKSPEEAFRLIASAVLDGEFGARELLSASSVRGNRTKTVSMDVDEERQPRRKAIDRRGKSRKTIAPTSPKLARKVSKSELLATLSAGEVDWEGISQVNATGGLSVPELREIILGLDKNPKAETYMAAMSKLLKPHAGDAQLQDLKKEFLRRLPSSEEPYHELESLAAIGVTEADVPEIKNMLSEVEKRITGEIARRDPRRPEAFAVSWLQVLRACEVVALLGPSGSAPFKSTILRWVSEGVSAYGFGASAEHRALSAMGFTQEDAATLRSHGKLNAVQEKLIEDLLAGRAWSDSVEGNGVGKAGDSGETEEMGEGK